MAKEAIYTHEGKVIDVTAPHDIKVGDVVVMGDLIGVANVTAQTGELLGLSVSGVFQMTAKSDDIIEVGNKLYWDDTAKELTLTADSNTFVGVATTAKADVAGVVSVRMV